MITPVSTMASKVKNMPSNRSTISGNAGYIKSEYKLHSENNQFRELKKNWKNMKAQYMVVINIERLLNL